MKKVFFSIFAILTIISAGCGEEHAVMNVEAFEIMDNKPYILMDGKIFRWDGENEWVQLETDIPLKEIFRGDYLCGINEEGALIFEMGMTSEEYGAFPLGGAGIFYMAERLAEYNREKPIRTLNHSAGYEGCWALCEDGSLLLPYGDEYFAFTVPDETVRDISGDFVLTENGNVYQLGFSETGAVSYQKVSDGPIVFIEANETVSRCIGIYEDGRVVMWSNITPLDLSEWKNVKEAAIGFDYCVGLTEDGKILYADYDEKRECTVKELLDGRTAQHIACAYRTLAILKKDGCVEMIETERVSYGQLQ